MTRDMPAFCHFWHMTPGEYRTLQVWEYRAMMDYQERFQREERDRIRQLSGG